MTTDTGTPSLLDLLPPGPGDTQGRTTPHRYSTPALQALTDSAAAAGWLPDAWHAAAWGWLQSAWLGQASVSWRERGADANASAVATAPLSAAPRMTGGAWAAQVDAARRQARAAQDDANQTEFCWQAASSMSEAGAPCLGLDTGTGHLWLRDPAGRLSAGLASAWLATIDEVAQALHRQPDAALSSLLTLAADSRKRQLWQFNAPLPALDAALTVHGMFARRAQQDPAATAAIDGAMRWSYSQLDGHAKRVAATLLAEGIQPGERVGLLMERSAPALAAMLGVLQAGACYVPIQPDYPAERIGFMLRDAGIRLLLVSAELAQGSGTPADVQALVVEQLLEQQQAGDAAAVALPQVDTACCGLCHVHLGLYRAAQGHRDLPPIDPAAGGRPQFRATASGRTGVARRTIGLRRGHAGNLGPAAGRRMLRGPRREGAHGARAGAHHLHASGPHRMAHRGTIQRGGR